MPDFPLISWRSRAPCPPEPGQLQVWLLVLANGDPDCEEWLDSTELERCAGMRLEPVRRRFVASRRHMRRILAGAIGCEPGDIAFEKAQGGKPFIARPATQIQFNLTHSGDLGLLAVSNGVPMGVDLEQVRPVPRWQAIAARVFTPEVCARLANTDANQVDVHFFRQWTALEALQKAAGQGLFADRVDPARHELRHFLAKPDWQGALAWPAGEQIDKIHWLTLDSPG